MSDTVLVGAIAGAFGVRGEARIKSFCAEPEAIATYGPLTTEDGQSLTLRITRAVKGGFAVRLSGVTTREQAEAMKGTRLYAPRDCLPSLPDDEFYHADLIGLTVVDPGGSTVGTVRAVHDFGAGDVLEIRTVDRRDLMLPFTAAIVPTVDLGARRVVADLAEAGEDAPPGQESDNPTETAERPAATDV